MDEWSESAREKKLSVLLEMKCVVWSYIRFYSKFGGMEMASFFLAHARKSFGDETFPMIKPTRCFAIFPK